MMWQPAPPRQRQTCVEGPQQPRSQPGRGQHSPSPISLLLHPLQVAALGDIPKAFRAAMFALDRAWRDMHPFNHNVLDGVSLAAAYVDLTTDTLYVASTGGCRVLVGSRSAAGNLQITTDVGENEGSRGLAGGIATVQLTEDVDSIILGSAGLW